MIELDYSIPWEAAERLGRPGARDKLVTALVYDALALVAALDVEAAREGRQEFLDAPIAMLAISPRGDGA